MRQPSGSKIQLKSKADRLELIIPARFRPDRAAIHQLGLAGGVDFAALILVGLIIYISILLSDPAKDAAVKIGLSAALLFLLPLAFWLLQGGLRMSFELADKFLSHTKIRIDNKQFTLSQHLYSLDRGRPKHLKTKEIGQIIVDSYKHPDFKHPKVSLLVELRETDPIRVLSTGQDLTDREIKWLARELSNWLGVNLVSMNLDIDEL
jgi:uncharacterized membrane protein YqjE